MITITEAAKNRVIELLAEENKDKTYFLRIGVKGGGCSGLSYLLKFDNEQKEFDEKFEDKGIVIVCDKKSILYLFGMELDYSSGLNGKGFEFNNPNSSRTCGCGQSFSV